MRFNSVLPIAAAAVSIAMTTAVKPASAFTVYGGAGTVRPCSAVVSGADSCAGVYDGNDSLTDLNSKISTVSGLSAAWGTGWNQVARVNSPAAPPTGSTVSGFNVASSGGSGTWNISGISIPSGKVLSSFIIALKAANDYAYYHFGSGTPLSGTWSTANFLNNGNRQPDLSHATLYAQFENAPNAVPEPFTIVGSGVALGVGAMMRKKQQKKEKSIG
ncbi:PEP-CTERM sorting domain-containing protein [Leptolyngbya sp. GGD]|uniref:PEP-CTERM sorting domain-containing protein n=1 Tax=Leptolyngbya sp. GGD TaxID=2997907 RepID=UPI00227C5CA6|nr:PEP-CTERM sorting domain-containing protein [Leptolyngbya sp. GGD]MCY6489291.1 PEP-CTERM sorting domain-containing protein [Leptolyngbya sp. GGD]